MKTDIQPKYFQAKVTCNCGNEFVTGSTKEEIRVEVCSNVIHFIQVSKRLLQFVERLRSSIADMVLTVVIIRVH